MNIKTIRPNIKNAKRVEKEFIVKGKQYTYIINASWKTYEMLDNRIAKGRTVFNMRFAHSNESCSPANTGKSVLRGQIDVFENKAPKGMFL